MQTIHRSLGIKAGFLDPSDAPQRPRKVLRNADVVVIDEISMCRIDLFDYVASMILAAQRAAGRKQVVLVGDFFQLPPVVSAQDQSLLAKIYADDWAVDGFQNWDGFCFASRYWKGLALVPCVLHEVVRQEDAAFQKALNELRSGDASCMGYFNRRAIRKRDDADPESIWLCVTNASADGINEDRLSEIDAKPVEFEALETGEVSRSDKPAPDHLVLKAGARVMSVCNGDGYSNGSIGTVVDCARDDGRVEVLFDDGGTELVGPHTWKILKARASTRKVADDVTGDVVERRTVENVEVGSYTQMPFRLAYAITVHKSQGQTFEKAVTETHAFAPGQLYVALSRCRTIEGLQVYPKVERRYVSANEAVVAFYDSLEDSSDAPPGGEAASDGSAVDGEASGSGSGDRMVAFAVPAADFDDMAAAAEAAGIDVDQAYREAVSLYLSVSALDALRSLRTGA